MKKIGQVLMDVYEIPTSAEIDYDVTGIVLCSEWADGCVGTHLMGDPTFNQRHVRKNLVVETEPKTDDMKRMIVFGHAMNATTDNLIKLKAGLLDG